MDVSNREIVLFAITANPTASWLENVVRTGFCTITSLPEVMVSDRDGIFGDWFKVFLKDYFDIKLFRTPPRTPNCNSFIERWHRTLREEMLDHCLVFGSRDLEKLVSEFVEYYHFHRPHQNLGQDSPLKQHNAKLTNIVPRIKRKKMVDGLVTNFEFAA